MNRQRLYDEFDKLLDEAAAAKNCGNCIYCSLSDNICNKYNAQPPMKVVLNGCSAFEKAVDDDIPY